MWSVGQARRACNCWSATLSTASRAAAAVGAVLVALATGALTPARLVTGLLVVTGLARNWDRAADAATVVAAIAVAVLAVPVLISAVNLRAVAAQPAPAPTGGGRGGCACGAGGCGA